MRLKLLPNKKDSADNELKSLGLDWQEQSYHEREKIKKAYELGSRWALLFYDLVREGKINEDLLGDEEFQLHMIHGLLNSLGFSKRPQEERLYYRLYQAVISP